MKGKCKKILSLALVLAMVVQLFAGLGNVAKASSATEVTITGLGGYSASYTETTQEQIGFTIKETISDGNWYNATITSGGVTLNGEVKNSFRIQLTGQSSFVLVRNGYQPASNDIITIPAGTQFTINDTDVYEITNEYTIKYDGTTWSKCVEGTPITITGRHTQNDASANGDRPEQIGFAVNGTIKDGEWYNATITSGAVKKNGEEQSDWKVLVTGSSTFSLVCWNYTPVVGDIITIPAGTQFTINDTDDVYEITNEYTIIFDKYGWRVATENTTDITIKGLGGGYHDYTGSTKQIGFDISESISIGTSYWGNNSYMTYGSILLNNNAQSTWYIFSTQKSDFVLVCPNYTAANGDIIKFLAGTQFTCEGVGYEITNDFAIQWDGTTWAEYVEPVEGTPITITGRHTQNDASANGDTPEQIGFAIDGTIEEDHWYEGSITYGSILLNGDSQSEWKVTPTGTNRFNLVCWNYTPVVGDIIMIPAGTQFTTKNTGDVYQITNDYTIIFDKYGWRVAAEYTTDITIKQFAEYSTSQIEFDINEAITIGKVDWVTRYYMTYGSILLDDEAQSTWYIYTKEASNFVLVCPDYTLTNGDVIKILAGTQFTCEGTVYEIANDCTVYYMNGVFADSPLYTITKIVGDETIVETVSGTYTLPEISTKKGYITLGWDVDGTLYKVGDVLSAKDEGYTIKPVHVAFSQLDGAQVRISAPEDEKVGGIRFICKLGSDSKSEHILQMGMLIIPTDYMTMGELTHENYGEQTGAYGTSKGYREFVVDNAGMKLEVFAQDEVANGTQAYYLKGSIVNLKDYNYTRNYSARSFLKVQYKDGAEYIYTDYSKDNNSRRICDIAKKMIETYPEQYAPNQNKKYPIVYEYAKVADTMESFAFYGPQAVISNGEYNVDETKQAMQEYANTGFKYLLMDGVGYHVDNTFGTTTLEEEQTVYNSPRVPELDLKQTMQIAKECGLEIIVLDWTLYKLSTSDIPLVETSASKDQVIAMCIKTTDSAYELIGSAIDETQFDKEDGTYTYNGESATVLHYVEQFESDDALKDWVGIKMSAYAKEDNFRGVRLVDEPRESQYTAIAVLTKVIKELYPNAYIQTGNLPSYSEVYDSDYNTWSKAWSNLLEVNTNATEVGLNYYPYKMNTGITGHLGNSIYELQSNYLRTLQELAITTRDKGLNLELSIQSFAQQDLHHTVNAQRLSLQAHLALAFGTKTLGSFLYTAADNSFTQTIVSDNNLRNAVLYANKNGNYLKAHMTFFKYQGSKVYGSGDYVSASGLTQLDTLQKSIITVPSGATVLVNEFYNQYTGQYGYYIVNLATLHNTSTGVDINNGDITINLSTDCLVYKDYQSYQSEEKNKVNSVTLSDGQGAFIVVED